MKTNIIQIVLAVLAAGSGFSCNHWNTRNNEQLIGQALQLTEQQPDSALILLYAVDTTLLGHRQHALYVLATVQARDKAHKDIAADTAICLARNFFIAANDTENAALAGYYAGRTYQERKNSDAAMRAFVQAGHYASQLIGNEHLKGLIWLKIGDSYYDCDKPAQAAKHYKQAVAYLRAARQDAKEIIALNSIGLTYMIRHKFDSALYFFNQVSAMPAFANDTEIQASHMQSMGVLFRFVGEPIKARKILMVALKQATNDHTKTQLYVCLSQTYHSLHQPDSARHYADLALELCQRIANPPLASTYGILADIEEKQGNYQEALGYARQQNEYIRKVFDTYEQQNIEEIERKYNYEVALNEQNRLTIHVQKMWLWLSGLLLVFVTTVLCWGAWSKKLIAGKNEKIHSLTEAARQTNHENEQIKADIAHAKKTIAELQREKENYRGTADEEKRRFEDRIDAQIRRWEDKIFHLGDEIRKSYAQALEVQLQIIDRFEKFKLGLDKKTNGYMISQLDQALYGKKEAINWDMFSPQMPEHLEDNIRMAYPGLDSTEVRICCLYLFDRDPETISKILALYMKSLYTKNSNVKRKIGIRKMEELPGLFTHFLYS